MASTSTRARRAALTAAGLATALIVTGCASGATPSSSGSASSFDGVELTVWNNIDFEPYQSLQKGYFESCAADLGIKVDVETITSDYNAKLLQAAASKSLPDIALLSTDTAIPQLASEGLLTDLSTVGITTEGLSDVVAGLGTYDDTLYGLPVQVEAYSTFFNAADFTAAGITEAPQTFAEYVSVAKQLTTADHFGVVLPGANDGSTPQYFLPFLLSAGGDPADPLSDGAVAAVDLYKQLVDEGALSKEFVNWGWDAPDQWKAGKAVSTVTGPWELVNSSLDIDFGTAAFPVLKAGDKPVVNLLGYAYGVTVQENDVDAQAAAALVECRASEANQIETAEQGGYIPALTTAQDAFVASVPAAKAFVDAIPNAFNAASLGTEWNTLQQVYVEAIQNAAINGVDAKTALEAAVAAHK